MNTKKIIKKYIPKRQITFNLEKKIKIIFIFFFFKKNENQREKIKKKFLQPTN
jgi:hypothetical protein